MKRAVRLSLLVSGLVLLLHVPAAQGQKQTQVLGQGQAQIRLKQAPTGWLGIYVQEQSIADSTQYPVLVSVEPGSPAQSAGLAAGDTILSFNNIDARGNFGQLQRFLVPGERVALKLRRNGVRSVSVPVAVRPPPAGISIDIGPLLNAAIATTYSVAPLIPFQLSGLGGSAVFIRIGVFGAEIADVTEEMADALEIKFSGVMVLNVLPGTPAKEAGLKGGDIIFKVDTTPVKSSEHLIRVIQNAPNKKVNLELVRKGKKTNKLLKWS